MKNTISYGFFTLLGAVVGFGLSWLIYQDKVADSDEDIISSEIELLNRSESQMPDCTALSRESGIYALEYEDFILIWRQMEQGDQIEKIVLNKDLLAASDSIKNPCL